MANKNLDNYKPLKFYKANSKARANGFAKFTKGDAHYFALYKDGEIALISESYTSEAGRDNGVESVRKNSKIKARYEFDSRAGGKHGFSLKAGNHQEIALSPSFTSKKRAEHVAGRLNGSVKAAAKKKAAPKAKAARKKNDEDNYRRLAFYEKHTKGRKNGLESFKGDDGLHYFAVFEHGKIRMISEGYPTTNALETGMASVKKNMKLENRYQYRGPFKNGKYDFRLKAGNGKEIARSVWYGSASAAATGAAYLMGKRKRAKPKPKVAKVAPAAAVAATAPVMAAAARPAAPRDKDDDYLKCEEYHGHPVTDKANNLALFSHANNKEYFVIYDDDGDVLIRSEGFESISKRSSELAAVLRLKDNPDNYERMEKNGYFMDILKDETGREVGRSCLRKIAPVAAAVPVAAAAPIAAATATPAASGGWGWLKWLLLGLLALLALFFLLKSCKPKVAPPPPPVVCWDDSEAETRALCPKKVTCWDGSFVNNASACPVEPVTCWDGSKVDTQAQCPAQTYTCWDDSTVTDLASCPPEPVKPPEPVDPVVMPTDFGRICGPSNNVLFNVPNYSPKPVSYLGSNPQFGNSHGLSSQQFYNKLASAHAAGGFDRAFLNLMARSLGYSGFSAMDASMFTDDTLAKGTKGLLGFGLQHSLQYSTLNMAKPADLEAFRVTSANGTDVHILKTCGNYMYVCN